MTHRQVALLSVVTFLVGCADAARSAQPRSKLAGKIFGGPSIESRGKYHEGLARIRVVGYKDAPHRWGYVDRKGKIVIEPTYFVAGDFSEGLAAVRWFHGRTKPEPGYTWRYHEHRVGYINKKGETVIKPQFLYAQAFSDGLAVFSKEFPHKSGQPGHTVSKGGYIDKTGKVVIPATFDSARPFSEGLAYVRPDKKTVYVTRTVTQAEADRHNRASGAHPSSKFYVLPGVRSRPEDTGKYGIIDKMGKYVVEAKFDKAGSQFKNGKSSGVIDGKAVIVDKTGKITPVEN